MAEWRETTPQMNEPAPDDAPSPPPGRWLRALAALVPLPLAALSLLLLASARTPDGALAAVTGLALASIPWCALARARRALRAVALAE
jgi:hypothetical protein